MSARDASAVAVWSDFGRSLPGDWMRFCAEFAGGKTRPDRGLDRGFASPQQKRGQTPKPPRLRHMRADRKTAGSRTSRGPPPVANRPAERPVSVDFRAISGRLLSCSPTRYCVFFSPRAQHTGFEPFTGSTALPPAPDLDLSFSGGGLSAPPNRRPRAQRETRGPRGREAPRRDALLGHGRERRQAPVAQKSTSPTPSHLPILSLAPLSRKPGAHRT